MPTPSFFQYWFDSDYRQRRDIEETSDQVHALEDQLTRSGMAMVSLHTQIAELSATVSVLLKMLGDAGQVDMKVLRYRVEAELDVHRAPASDPEPVASMPAEITCAK